MTHYFCRISFGDERKQRGIKLKETAIKKHYQPGVFHVCIKSHVFESITACCGYSAGILALEKFDDIKRTTK